MSTQIYYGLSNEAVNEKVSYLHARIEALERELDKYKKQTQ